MKKENKSDVRSAKKITSEQAVIEGILFLENKFITEEELSKKSGYDTKTIHSCIEKINVVYAEHGHALTILAHNNSYMMVIKKDLASIFKELYPSRVQQKLSRVLLETLAIIAYSQPITRAEIQALRGVNPENAIKMLIEQGLVHVVGKKSIAGSPNEYGTTSEFLRTFGLSSIKDLPKLQGHEENLFT